MTGKELRNQVWNTTRALDDGKDALVRLESFDLAAQCRDLSEKIKQEYHRLWKEYDAELVTNKKEIGDGSV